jgi:hypothetical protein
MVREAVQALCFLAGMDANDGPRADESRESILMKLGHAFVDEEVE